jgi:hypothetical protein
LWRSAVWHVAGLVSGVSVSKPMLMVATVP